MMSQSKLQTTLIGCLAVSLLIFCRDSTASKHINKSPHKNPIVKTKELPIDLKVKKIIARQFGVKENIPNDASFINDLGKNSLDVVELIMMLEQEFEIEIPDNDAEKIKTVQDAINYITSKITNPKSQ